MKKSLNKYALFLRAFGIIAAPFYLYIIPIESEATNQSQLFKAFSTPHWILFALACSMVAAVPFGVDLFFDYCLRSASVPQTDLLERFFLLFFIFGPPLFVILNKDSNDLSAVYTRAHMSQHIGYVSIIYGFAIQSFPDFFYKPMFIASLFALAVSCGIIMFSVYDGYSLRYISGMILFMLATTIFAVYCLLWLYEQVYLQLKKRNPLSVEALPLILYITVALISLVSMPSAIIFSSGINTRNFNESSIISFICAYSSFNILTGSIPGRIARILVDLKSDALTENRRSLIRFFCHEIRSPLNVLNVGLTLFNADRLDLDSLSIQMNLVSECASATALVNNLSNYEEIDSGNMKLTLCEQPIETVRSCVRNCHEIARKRGTGFVFKDETTAANCKDCLLLLDCNKIDEAIRAIFFNAMSFTSSIGSVLVTMRLEGDQPDPTLLTIDFSSSDTGMSRDKRARLLQNFHAFDEFALRGGVGAGLELWVTKKIVEMHKGSVNIAMSERYKVKIVLPLKPLSSAHNEKSSRCCWMPLLGWTTNDCMRCPSLYRKVFADDQDVNNLLDIEANGQQAVALVTQSTTSPLPVTKNALKNSRDYSVMVDEEQGHAKPSLNADVMVTFEAPRNTVIDCLNQPNDEKAVMEVASSCPVKPPSSHHSLQANDESKSVQSNGRVEERVALDLPNTSSTLAIARKKKRLTFLVVDDSPLNRKFIIRIVRKLYDNEMAANFLDLKFVEAADGVPAVDYITRSLSGADSTGRMPRNDAKEVHAILLDNIMTEMHGPEVAAAVRAMGYRGPIVGITGNVLAEDVRDFLLKGANHVLPKPIDVGGMKEIFRALLPEHLDFIA